MKNLLKESYKEDYDYGQVKEGFEMMPSDGEVVSEDNIRKPSIISSPKDYSKKDNNSKDNLERMLKEQSIKINELFDYKKLCEDRIKQLMPSHPIPVKETHLKVLPKKFEDSIKANKDLENHNLKKEIQSYKNTIIQKEQEIEQLKKKFDNNQFKQSWTSDGFKLSATLPKKSSAISSFPTPDRVPNERLRETYQSLLQNYNVLQYEKDNILESLRIETLHNEEKKNYIEILKQTIENKINKMGLNSALNNQKNTGIYKGKDVSSIDILVDVSQLHSECDRYRKELIMMQMMNQELKNEVELLNKTTEDMKIKKEKIRDSLNGGIRELEMARERIGELESEKNDLIEENYSIKSEFEKMMKEYDTNSIKNKRLEKEMADLIKKINEANMKLNENSFVNAKLNEFKLNCERLTSELEGLNYEKTKIEEELSHYKEIVNNKNEEIKNMKDINQSACDKLELEKKSAQSDNISIVNKLKKVEKLNTELQCTIKDNRIDITNLEDKIASLNQYISELKNNNDSISSDIDRLKKQYEGQIENLEQSLRDSNSNYKDLKYQNENLQNEKKILKEDNFKLKSESLKLENEVKKISENLEMTKKNFDSLNDKYDELLYNFRQSEVDKNNLKSDRDELTKDVKSLKEKYEKDITNKNNEIKQCNIEINNLKFEFRGCKDKLSNNKEQLDKDKVEIIELKSIIEVKDKKIESLLEKDILNTKKIEDLIIISQKYDTLTLQNNQLHVDFTQITFKYEKLQQEKEYLTESLEQKDKVLFEIQEKYSELLSNFNSLSYNFNELQKKSEKSHFESVQLGEKSLILSHENQNSKKTIEEMSSTIETLNLHKEKLESNIQILIEEKAYLKNLEGETRLELNKCKHFIERIKEALLSSICNVKSSIHVKFFMYVGDPYLQISPNFTEMIENLQKLKLKDGADLIECVNLLEEIVTDLSNEIENFKYKIDNLRRANSSNRLTTLDKNYYESDQRKVEGDSQIRKQLSEFAEDNRMLLIENENYLKRLEDCEKEKNTLTSENKKLINEISKLRYKLNEKANVMDNDLNSSAREYESNMKINNFQISSLEEKLAIALDEKKSYEALITKVINNYPNREISKVLMNYFNSLEVCFEKQREKSQLEKRINQLSFNENIDENTRKELENNKNLFKGVIQLINDNTKLQSQYENELRNLESYEKKKNEKYIQNEQLIKKLEYELQFVSEELRKYKHNLSSTNFTKSLEVRSSIPSTLTLNQETKAKLEDFESINRYSSKRDNNLNSSISYNYLQGSNNFNNNFYESQISNNNEGKKYNDESYNENRKNLNGSLRKKENEIKISLSKNNANSSLNNRKITRPYSHNKALNMKNDNDF